MPRRPAAAARTHLSRALSEEARARVGPLDFFALARRRWLAGERLDIGALATQLGIARATAFRWVGSRDLLVGEILWSLCAPTLQRAAAASRARGARRVAAVTESTIRSVLSFAPLRRFVRQDPEYALRLLTSKHGPVQARAIAAVRDLLQAESNAGRLRLPLAVDTLAYLIVRIGESFIYADVISDQSVDLGDAGLAVELLLSGKVQRTRR